MKEVQSLSITTGSWMRGLLVVALGYALYQVSEFLLVLIASVVIASAIEPAAQWAKRHNIPRLPMILLVFIFSALLLAGLFYFLLLPLLGEMNDFVRTLSIYSNSVINDSVVTDLFRSQNFFGNIDTPLVIRELSTRLGSLSSFLSQGVFSSLSVIFGGVLNFGLILILSFYLVVQEDGVNKFLRMITPVKHEEYVSHLWKRTQVKIGLWMQGQLLSSALVTALVYIGLLIIGVPHALLLAVLAGVFELIPIFGSILSAIPALFLALISGGTTMFFITAGFYIVVQQFEGNLIYPMVVKKVVGVPPIISIAALVIGGTLAGFLGVLISVPVATFVIELISDFEERKLAQLSTGARIE